MLFITDRLQRPIGDAEQRLVDDCCGLQRRNFAPTASETRLGDCTKLLIKWHDHICDRGSIAYGFAIEFHLRFHAPG